MPDPLPTMSALDWALRPLKLYARFTGRARRSEFWWFALLVLAIYVVGTMLDTLFGLATITTYADPAEVGFGGRVGFTTSGDPITALAVLALFVPSLAVAVRRLHDVDRSGWWLLLGLIPIAGMIVLIVFYATDGTRGANRFGADPKRGG
jgi:uncharacterized membrane protein YhaH (DUF805 family)